MTLLLKKRDYLKRNEQLADYEHAPTSAGSRELAAAYQELVKAFNDPVNNEELIANSQEQVQKLLHELSQQGRNDELLAQAQELSAGMAGLINMLKSQYSAIEDLYFDLDASDYIKQNVTEGWQQLKSLETTIRVTEKALIDLCVECWLPVPNLTQVPIISKVALKKAINALLDILVPGSEVVKAALGTRPMPQAPEEWADLAIEVGLDFIPFGLVSVCWILPLLWASMLLCRHS